MTDPAAGSAPEIQVPGRPPRILLTGTYCAANKGNAAITLGAVKGLKQAFPDARITLLTAFPDLDAPAYPGVRIVPCSRRSARIFLLALRALAARTTAGAASPPPGEMEHISEFQEYSASDLIVDISGDSISENYGLLVGVSHLMPLLIGTVLGKKVVVYGQSIGPFRLLPRFAGYVLNRTRLITVRERLSMRLLERLRINRPRVELTCDPAFLMEETGGEERMKLLGREGLHPGAGPLLGVNASPLHGHKVSGMPPGPVSQAFLRKVARACDRWIAGLGCTLVLLPHVTGPDPGKDERGTVMELYRLIRDKERVRPILTDYPTQDMKGIVSAMDLFVGVRMHANIAALSSGVPTVSLAYSHKAPGIMSMLGQDKWVLDIHRFGEEDLARTVEAAWAARTATREKLRSILPGVRREAFRNAFLAKELLENP
jgi:colanic acid/amylovoran biosynthesis protein